MKVKYTVFALIIGAVFLNADVTFAQRGQGMMEQGTVPKDDHTAREEAEGKAVWEKLQAKQVTCGELTEEDYGVLGEYFMGQMMGDAHPAMNQMMTSMMGEEGEEAMHVVMGKRLSGCDTTAAFPASGIGFMPMMNVMMGGWSSPGGFDQGGPMMGNFGYGSLSIVGFLGMLLWWMIIIAAVVALVRWITGQGRIGRAAPLDILKERYAKGEIDKKEFEEKKRELVS